MAVRKRKSKTRKRPTKRKSAPKRSRRPLSAAVRKSLAAKAKKVESHYVL